MGWFNLVNPWKVRQEAVKVIAPNMDALGKLIVAKAVELVPVDTGKLRDSIGYTFRHDTSTLQIHADMDYAIFVEMGTRRTRAQPYLRPALDAAPALWTQIRTVQFQFSASGESGVSSVRDFVQSIDSSQVRAGVRISA